MLALGGFLMLMILFIPSTALMRPRFNMIHAFSDTNKRIGRN